jgi:hypothetical protein
MNRGSYRVSALAYVVSGFGALFETLSRAAFAPKALRRASPKLARTLSERRREGFGPDALIVR